MSDRGFESSFGSTRFSLFNDQLRKADKKDLAALQNKLIESNQRNDLKDHRIKVLEVEFRKLKADRAAALKERDDMVAKLQAKARTDAERIRRLLRDQEKVVQCIHQIVQAAKETADENDRANANLEASRSSEARVRRENDGLRVANQSGLKATLAAEQANKLTTQRELCELRRELQVVYEIRDKAQAEASRYQATVEHQHQELTQAQTHEQELEMECQKLLTTSARDNAEIEGLKGKLEAKDAEHKNQLSKKDAEYAERLHAKDVEIKSQRVAFEKEIARFLADHHSQITPLRDLPLVVVTQHDPSGTSVGSSSSFSHPVNDASTHIAHDHISFVNIGQDSASFWASEDSVTNVRPSRCKLAVRPSPILLSSTSENKSSLLQDASSLEIRVSSTSCDLVNDRISLPGIDQVSSSWASARGIECCNDAPQVLILPSQDENSTGRNRVANTSDNLLGGQTSLYAISPDTSSCWRMPPGAPKFPRKDRSDPPLKDVSISSTSPQPSFAGEHSAASLEIPRGVGSFDLLHDKLSLSGLNLDSFWVDKASATPVAASSARAPSSSAAPEATFEIPSCQASFNIVHDKISLTNADADSFWVSPPRATPSSSAADKDPERIAAKAPCRPPTPYATALSGEPESQELPSNMGSFNLLHDNISFPLSGASSLVAGISGPSRSVPAASPVVSKVVGPTSGPPKRAGVKSASKLDKTKPSPPKRTESKTTRRPLARLVDAGNTPARPRRRPAQG
ncbi:hypothetical protein C8Q79DRAFT_923987 [Trametes meyenii]|nr:hypothetical protein C8Q79DRAFT_923987 [Trametes meyenii]